jgi:hypothetical protein
MALPLLLLGKPDAAHARMAHRPAAEVTEDMVPMTVAGIFAIVPGNDFDSRRWQFCPPRRAETANGSRTEEYPPRRAWPRLPAITPLLGSVERVARSPAWKQESRHVG